MPRAVLQVCIAAGLLGVARTVVPPDVPTATQWCDSRARCREDGDALAFCDYDHMMCSCSEGHTPVEVSGVWQRSTCATEHRTASAVLTFEGGQCGSGNSITAARRLVLIAAVQAATNGVVQTFTHVCKGLTIALTIRVPYPDLARAESATLQARLESQIARSPDLLGWLGTSVAVTSGVSGPVAPGFPAQLGGTDAPDTPAPAYGGPLACIETHAEVALRIEVDGVLRCQPTQCETGFALQSVADTYTCAPASGGAAACLVDGDCTSIAGRTSCRGFECVDATVVPPKTTSVVMRPSSLWGVCSNGTDCQATGDVNATCVERDIQYNYCECTGGYEHAALWMPVCVIGESETVSVGFTVLFENSPACETFGEDARGVLSRIVAGLLGEVTYVTHTCNPLAVMGVVQVNRTAVDAYASGEASLKHDINFFIRNSGNVDLQGQGGVTNAGVSNGQMCDSVNAVHTMFDAAGSCHAVACLEGFMVVQNMTYVCIPVPPTPAPSDDDALSRAQTTVLALAGVFLLLLVAVIVLACCKNRSANTEDDESEPKASEAHEPVSELSAEG